jgi:SAM-dependent methyltransferase
MKSQKNDEIRQAVRKTYGDIARTEKVGCGCAPTSCCGPENVPGADVISQGLGYSKEDVSGMPQGANMGLGCGNPQAIASLKPGETVLDLGSGGGFDCFLASKAVGDKGRVIGVDMTPDMISKARKNSDSGGYKNVEFRLGEIEHLPVEDNSIDVIISNCVINLAPDKREVYTDAFRVLKKGGRLAISDIVTLKPIPEALQKDIELYTGCISGALQLDELKSILVEAGFTNIQIDLKEGSKEFISQWLPGKELEDKIASANIQAVKP